jgi:hypothetical protein
VIIPERFNGPPASANGGYTCGLLARKLGGVAEVTLRRPPPLGVALDVVAVNGCLELRHGPELIAEACAVELDVDVPAPVSLEEAEEASARFAGFEHHAYPTCFTCGPGRQDGLHVFAGPVAGREELVASPWNAPRDVRPEIVWAALDCPAGWAVDDFGREGVLLGRMAARIDGEVSAGETHIVLGWRLGEEGRKRYAGSAVYSEPGDLLAVSRSTWIVPKAAELRERGLVPGA